jgi:dTDP-4-dehydrorhamnose 3,5-epimerase
MKFKETSLLGNYLIDLDLREDERGFFARYFCVKEFSEQGLNTQWMQINNSTSREVGTLRGLHFQRSPHSEVKLVRCLHGAIWDVVVDLRGGSKTFGKWFGATLSDQNRTMMYIPKGFAHGFISLEPDSEILYLVSDFYTPESEVTLIWNDLDVGIQWPLDPQIMSDKDLEGRTLSQVAVNL